MACLSDEELAHTVEPGPPRAAISMNNGRYVMSEEINNEVLANSDDDDVGDDDNECNLHVDLTRGLVKRVG